MHDIPRRRCTPRRVERLDTDFLPDFVICSAQRRRHRSRTNLARIAIGQWCIRVVDSSTARSSAMHLAARPVGCARPRWRDCSWMTSTRAAAGSFCAARHPVKAEYRCRLTSARRQTEVRPIPLGFFARVVAAADVKTTIFRRRFRRDAQADSCASSKVHPVAASAANTDTECSSGMVRRRSGVAGFTVELRSLLCTYCSFALETSVGHLRRSDLPPRTALGFRFRTSEHPALGPAQ